MAPPERQVYPELMSSSSPSALKTLRIGLLLICGVLSLSAQDAPTAKPAPLDGWQAVSSAIEFSDEATALVALKSLPSSPMDQEAAGECFGAALKKGFVQVCRSILKSGLMMPQEVDGSPHLIEADGSTLLMDAVKEGFPPASLELLIKDLRVPVDARTDSGMTALRFALEKGDIRSIQLLISHGAKPDPECWNVSGREVPGALLHYMVDSHLFPFPEESRSRFGLTARLADMGDPAFFARVVARGLEPQVHDPSGRTLLHLLSSPAAIRMVVQIYHLDVNARTKPDPTPWCGTGWDGICRSHTPLELAIRSNRQDWVAVLLELGADVQAVDEGGDQPLHFAMGSTPEIVDLLLKHGASLQWKNKKGVTPLQMALCFPQMASHLLKTGVNLSDEDKAFAVREAPTEVLIPLLQSAEVDPFHPYPSIGSPLAYVLVNRNLAVITSFLPAGDLGNPLTDQGETALHLLVQNSSLFQKDLIALINRIECPVNAVNSRGETALLLAVKRGRRDGAAALIARGADTRIRDKEGKSPLDYALEIRAKIPPSYWAELDPIIALLH